MEFNRKSLLELRKWTDEELNNYYMQLRKLDYEEGKSLKGIELRKRIHLLLLIIIKIDRLLKKEKITVLGDKSSRGNEQYIYASTHIGGNDVERVFESIRKHAYLMIGDPGINYVNETGFILTLNGYIPVQTRDKEDRKIAYNHSVELLNKKGSLLIFPEGAYNVFENLPTMGIYPGAARMSKETGSEIIPLAIEQYDNEFVVNIGENIVPKDNMSVREMTEELRDSLSTLKWEIWESRGISERKEFSPEFVKNFRQSIVDRDDRGDYSYTLQDIYETMYHDKSITSSEEAFAHLDNLIPSKENAFLLRKTK